MVAMLFRSGCPWLIKCCAGQAFVLFLFQFLYGVIRIGVNQKVLFLFLSSAAGNPRTAKNVIPLVKMIFFFHF
ncbi:MAG: hypothetical protein VX152_06775 [Pseudomonadota bacterium]|nr:hypothetical protein [Pseudomonadota bacterium]